MCTLIDPTRDLSWFYLGIMVRRSALSEAAGPGHGRQDIDVYVIAQTGLAHHNSDPQQLHAERSSMMLKAYVED